MVPTLTPSNDVRQNAKVIVSILVEGQYSLPQFLQVQGGKTTVQGTLASLKMFEKILKSD